jgi:hypothetical protein
MRQTTIYQESDSSYSQSIEAQMIYLWNMQTYYPTCMEGGIERQAVDDATMHRSQLNHVVTNTVPCRGQDLIQIHLTLTSDHNSRVSSITRLGP